MDSLVLHVLERHSLSLNASTFQSNGFMLLLSIYIYVMFLFLQTEFLCVARMSWNLLCRLRWPWTQETNLPLPPECHHWSAWEDLPWVALLEASEINSRFEKCSTTILLNSFLYVPFPSITEYSQHKHFLKIILRRYLSLICKSWIFFYSFDLSYL